MQTEKKIRNALIKLYWQAHNHGGLAEFEENISEQLKSKKWADIRALVIGEAMQKIQSAQHGVQPTCATSRRKKVLSKSKVSVGRTRG